MKKIIKTLQLCIISISVLGQAPQRFNYQAVLRNDAGEPMASQDVTVRIDILQGSVTGTSVYGETHDTKTNDFGLINLQIGSVQSLDAVDWGADDYFIQVSVDGTVMGTTQLWSVPYALHAETAVETDPEFTAWDKSTGISITESQISDLGNYIEAETDPSVPTGTQTGEMQYWNGTEWVTVAPGSHNQTLHFCNGFPTWGPCPIEVENPTTGAIWIDRNLGASQVATSSTDADSYGDLYQWGRAADGHQIRTSGTTSALSDSDTPGHGDFILAPNSPYDWRSPQNDNLWQGVSGTNNPCPGGYRLPTEAEWDAEKQSWSSSDAAGAFNSPLKLTVAGRRRYSNGSLINVGSFGWY